MNTVLIGNENADGGTAQVIRHLKKQLNCTVIQPRDLCSIRPREYDRFIAIQPKGIFWAIVHRMLNPEIKYQYFIFDTHPSSLNILKRWCYISLAFLALRTVGSSQCLVPNGPLAKIYPFSKMTRLNWSIFVAQLYSKVSKRDACERAELAYIGSISSAKKAFRAFHFWRDAGKPILRIMAYGAENLSLIKGLKIVTNRSDFDLNKCLLLVSSDIEAYGLAFKEFSKSGGQIVFLRELDGTEEVKNPLSFVGKPTPKSLLIVRKFIEIFPQEFLPDQQFPCIYSYLSNYENHKKL